MYDYANGSFEVGGYQITIGGAPGYTPYPNYPVNGIPPYNGTPGTMPSAILYNPPASNQNNQILMIGLVLLAVVLLSKR